MLVLFGSLVLDVTESVCEIVVPDATLLFTVTMNVKFAVVLAARLEIVHVGGAGVVVHVQVPGPDKDTSVVFAGIGSVKETVVAEA